MVNNMKDAEEPLSKMMASEEETGGCEMGPYLGRRDSNGPGELLIFCAGSAPAG